MAARITGSPDIFGSRGPLASINFITSHDGFTMADLVSYNQKHNQANREHNHDGESHNRSWNSGVEGPTDDARVQALRRRRAESMLATLLLSQGVPMILGGDELGRTQNGNNNAYCQDNEISWYDWERMDWDMVSFVQRVAALRRNHPAAAAARVPDWSPACKAGDIVWFTPAGTEMTDDDWRSEYARSLAVLIDEPDSDDPTETFYLMLNATTDSVGLPAAGRDLGTGADVGRCGDRSGVVRLQDFTMAVARMALS